jgi:uncharacterized cupin superfamily protein
MEFEVQQGTAPEQQEQNAGATGEARTWKVPWQGALAGVAAGLVFFAVCWALAGAVLSGVASQIQSSVPMASGLLGNVGGISASVGAQLAELSFFGTISGGYTAFITGGTASFAFAPVVLTLLGLALAGLGGFLVPRFGPSTSWQERLAQAIAVGVGLSVVLTVLAGSMPLAANVVGVSASFTAAGPVPFIVSLLFGAFAAWWGSGIRRPASPRIPAGPRRLRDAWALLRPGAFAYLAQTLLFVVVAVPVLLVVAGITGGLPSVLAFPFWLAHTVAGAFSLGHLGGITVGTSTSTSASGSEGTVSLFSSGLSQVMPWMSSSANSGAVVPVWVAVLLVLLALVCAVGAAIVLSALRRGSEYQASQWWAVPVSYAASALVGTWVFQVTASAGAGTVTTGFHAGAAWWLPLILAVWGLAVEAASRFAVPYLLGLLPSSIVGRVEALATRISPVVRPTAAPAAATGASSTVPAAAAEESILMKDSTISSAEAPAEVSPTPLEDALVEPGGSPAGTTASETGVAVRKMSPKGRKRALVILAAVGGAGVLAAAGALTLTLAKASKGPDAPVRAFLDDLVAGRAQAALEKASPDLPNDSRSLLTDEIYAKATGHIDKYSVISTETKDTTATVVVELGQDGRSQRQTFTLSKHDPNLFDDNWTLEPGALIQPVQLTVNTKNPKISINGVQAKPASTKAIGSYSSSSSSTGSDTVPDGWLTPLSTQETFYALPGTYKVTLDTGSPLIAAQDTSFTVALGAQAVPGAQVAAAVTKEFRTQLDASVKALLDKCTARTTAPASSSKSDGCPFGMYSSSSYDYRNVKWTITSQPTYKVGNNVYSDGAVDIEDDATGKAEVTYQKKFTDTFFHDDWSDSKDSDSIYLRGVATVKDGKVQFQYLGSFSTYTPTPTAQD